MSVSPAQVQAALGHLGLKQKDLYEAVGISRQAYHKFLATGRSGKKEAMQAFFEERGIEFLPHEGLRRKPIGIRLLKGYEGFKEFIDDVYATVREKGGHICVTHVDERQFERWQGVHAQSHLQRMARIANLTFQILVCEGDDYYTASAYAQYRKLPLKYFGETPTYIYGNKKAEITFGNDEVSLLITENAKQAESERKQFKLLWEIALA